MALKYYVCIAIYLVEATKRGELRDAHTYPYYKISMLSFGFVSSKFVYGKRNNHDNKTGSTTLVTFYDKYKAKATISMVSSDVNPGSPAVFSHGESPVWDHETQSLYFVDAHEQNVHRLDYATGKIHTKHIEYGQVNVVSLVSGSRRLVVAVRAALYLLDWAVPGDAALRLLAQFDVGHPDHVLNEGKPDAHGRFWIGTKGPQSGDDVLPDRATFYSVDQHSLAHPRVQLRPVSISNGLVWARNNSVLYYIDSPTQKVEAFDFDLRKGDISGRRTIVDIARHGFPDAIPDGLTIDSEGHLWLAVMFGGAVLQVDPAARRVVRTYTLPASRVTALCWGGPALDELFVTSGRDAAAAEPLAGAVFTIRGTGRRGLPANTFRFDNADAY